MSGYEYGGGGGFGTYDTSSYGGVNPMDDTEGLNSGGFNAMNEASGGAGGKGDKGKPAKNKSILPVSIHQVRTAIKADGAFHIDNMTPEMIRVFGTIESVKNMSTSVEFTISDGTGSISAKKWKDQKDGQDPSAAASAAGELWTEGAFVEVVGQLKDYQDATNLQIYEMWPVDDWNALTHHLLDIILSHNLNTVGPIPGSEMANKAPTAYAAGAGVRGGHAGMSPAHGGYGKAAQAQSGGSKDMDGHLLAAIKRTSNSEEGTTVEEVFYSLSKDPKTASLFTRETVARMVNTLTNDGMLYGTIDEMHFKSCED
jgi:replication factor A2